MDLELLLKQATENVSKGCSGEAKQNESLKAHLRIGIFLCDQVLEVEKDSVQAYEIRGFANCWLGNYEKAISDLNRRLELSGPIVNPAEEIIYRFLGNAQAELGRHEDAITSYAKAIRLKPKDASNWFHRAESLKTLERYQEALKDYNTSLKFNHDPEANCLLYANRGWVLYQLGKHKKALADSEKARRWNPNHSASYYVKGLVLSALNKDEEAVAEFDKAITLDPKVTLHYYHRHDSLMILGRFEEALANADQAIELKPAFNLAYHFRTVALLRLGRSEESLASALKAVEIDPNDGRGYNNLGAALNQLGRLEEAIESLTKVKELGADEAILGLALSHRGNSYQLAGQLKEAETDYQEALTIFQNIPKPNLMHYWFAIRAERGLVKLGLSSDHPIEKAVLKRRVMSAVQIEQVYRFEQ